jgi:spore coat polysaccharide biosynthesis protein SpsF (cytidylyltransferase family)
MDHVVNRKRLGIVVQARAGSSRLPGKTLRPIGGVAMLERLLRRMRMVTEADGLIVATGDRPENQAIVSLCQTMGVACHVGSENNCLQRMLEAVRRQEYDSLVRITADNPLIDPQGIDAAIRQYRAEGLEYLDNICHGGYPHGAGCEVVSRRALEFSEQQWRMPENLEHVTWALRRHINLFKHAFFQAPPALHRPAYRFSVDQEVDFQVVEQLYALHGWRDDMTLAEIIACLDARPELVALNEQAATDRLLTHDQLMAWQMPATPNEVEAWRSFKETANGLEDARQPIPQ